MRKTYGYIRVSSSDQNENRQLLACSRPGSQKAVFLWTNSLSPSILKFFVT